MQLRSIYSGSKIKGLFVIALISLSAIVGLYISYRIIVGNPGVEDAENLTVKKKEDLIYFLKDKLFYFQVTLDGVIIDTIYLKTYSKLLNKQGKISWIYDVNDFKPEEFSTGVVENDSVIWLHPPREYLYEIFQVVSFPNVLKPYEVGNKWSWKLSVSDKWICKDWNVYWKGFLNCNFNYEITGLGIVNVMGENLKCFIVKAESISAVGNTEALMYFHPQMGFVKLHYLKLYGHEMSITLLNVLEYSPNNSNWYEKGVI